MTTDLTLTLTQALWDTWAGVQGTWAALAANPSLTLPLVLLGAWSWLAIATYLTHRR